MMRRGLGLVGILVLLNVPAAGRDGGSVQVTVEAMAFPAAEDPSATGDSARVEIRVWVEEGSPAPGSSYRIELKHEGGRDILMSGGTPGYRSWQRTATPGSYRARVRVSGSGLESPVVKDVSLEIPGYRQAAIRIPTPFLGAAPGEALGDSSRTPASRIQIENSKSLIKQFNQSSLGGGAAVSLQDAEKYKAIVTETARLSEIIHKNFAAVSVLMEKVNSVQQLSSDKIQQLNVLANSITQASSSLTDERTLVGLKHLEAIVKK